MVIRLFDCGSSNRYLLYLCRIHIFDAITNDKHLYLLLPQLLNCLLYVLIFDRKLVQFGQSVVFIKNYCLCSFFDQFFYSLTKAISNKGGLEHSWPEHEVYCYSQHNQMINLHHYKDCCCCSIESNTRSLLSPLISDNYSLRILSKSSFKSSYLVCHFTCACSDLCTSCLCSSISSLSLSSSILFSSASCQSLWAIKVSSLIVVWSCWCRYSRCIRTLLSSSKCFYRVELGYYADYAMCWIRLFVASTILLDCVSGGFILSVWITI